MCETARACGSKVPRSHRSPSDRAHDTIPFILSFSLFFPSRDFIGLEFKIYIRHFKMDIPMHVSLQLTLVA